jgi:hypothetical protein
MTSLTNETLIDPSDTGEERGSNLGSTENGCLSSFTPGIRYVTQRIHRNTLPEIDPEIPKPKGDITLICLRG